MTNYGMENWTRFQRTGVETKDIKAMKLETVVEAFEDTKRDFEHLAKQLADGIKNGRWTAILGDDVSGRLPALIIGGLARRYSSEHNKKPPKQIFFAGGSVPSEDSGGKDEGRIKQEQQRRLEEYIHIQSKRLGERILVVTEQVRSGGTFRRIADALQKEGKSVDFATLWASKDAPYYERNTRRENNPTTPKDTRWFIGKENAGASDPFGSEVSNFLYNLGAPLNEAAGIKKAGT